jgi:hypothetical protein
MRFARLGRLDVIMMELESECSEYDQVKNAHGRQTDLA